MQLPTPAWLEDVPQEDRMCARTRFLLRLAALYASEGGGLGELSCLIGYESKHSLSVIISRRRTVSPEQAAAIETVVGREIVSREDLRPDVFLPA